MLHPNTEKLDCLVRVVTPENVEFEYALAGPFPRLMAFVFDFIVRAAAMFAFLLVLGLGSMIVPFGSTLTQITMILLFFVLSWFYGVYFESRFNGRTLGKMVFKLRVISTDGRPINGVQAALRNLLRSADTFPSPITGLICMTITTRFQRIGDLAAGTMVIVDRARRAPWDLQPDDPRAFGLAELIPHSFVANYMMTQSIGMYMENRRKLPMARRLEVARHLAGPLLIKFDMLRDTSPDLLLCAIFVRIFMSEQQQEAGRAQLRGSQARTGAGASKPIATNAFPQVTAPSVSIADDQDFSQSATVSSDSTSSDSTANQSPNNPQVAEDPTSSIAPHHVESSAETEIMAELVTRQSEATGNVKHLSVDLDTPIRTQENH